MKGLVLALGLAAGPADFEALWKALGPPADAAPKHLTWQMRVTPPFPETWPLGADGALVTYAYGAAFDPQLHDAERVSPPFARARETAAGAVVVTSLRASLSVAETQGFHPISRDEAALQASVMQSAAALRAGSLDAVRPAWCAWLGNHGAIVAQLPEGHRAFLAALKCR